MTYSTANGELRFSDIPVKPVSKKGKQWTPEDIERLKELYPVNTNEHLAGLFHRSESSISAKAFKLGLKKNSNWILSKSQKTWFKKGRLNGFIAPKGVHLSPNTEFKPGHKPYNTKYDGAISIRYDGIDENRKPYYHIRLANGEWEYLHRHIWKQINGEIPKYHLIRFIDGNTLNCDIKNLMCITRAQNAQLNQNRRKAAQTLRETNRKKKLNKVS